MKLILSVIGLAFQPLFEHNPSRPPPTSPFAEKETMDGVVLFDPRNLLAQRHSATVSPPMIRGYDFAKRLE